MSKIEVWMKYLVLDGGVEGSISNELCSCYTITYTFQMIYDVRWDEIMKYVCMSPHNAFGIYESNNLTLKWLLNNSVH